MDSKGLSQQLLWVAFPSSYPRRQDTFPHFLLLPGLSGLLAFKVSSVPQDCTMDYLVMKRNPNFQGRHVLSPLDFTLDLMHNEKVLYHGTILDSFLIFDLETWSH